MTGAERIEAAIRAPKRPGRPALVSYLVAGFPQRAGFVELLRAVASQSDVVELGVPFTDPMADGVTIQDASRRALADGTNLHWILQAVREAQVSTPILLMSYVNPLLAYGPEALVHDAADAGVSGFIVPDLPLDEAPWLQDPAAARGLAVVQLVTPVTPDDRLSRLGAASRGFLYAVTMRGTTGARALGDEVPAYLDRVRARSRAPVCAGFGIRERAQIDALADHADGVIVGSALVDAIGRGEDPIVWLRALAGAVVS